MISEPRCPQSAHSLLSLAAVLLSVSYTCGGAQRNMNMPTKHISCQPWPARSISPNPPSRRTSYKTMWFPALVGSGDSPRSIGLPMHYGCCPRSIGARRKGKKTAFLYRGPDSSSPRRFGDRKLSREDLPSESTPFHESASCGRPQLASKRPKNSKTADLPTAGLMAGR